MKLLKFNVLFFVLTLTLLTSAFATQTQEEQPIEPNPQGWVSAVEFVEKTILSEMEKQAANKRWDEASELLNVYRKLGSNQNAGMAIGKMLIKKNRDGAVTVIKLTHQELINPFHGPIDSTKTVKVSLIKGVQTAQKQRVKQVLMNTFLNIFTLDGLTPSERTAVEELKKAVDEDLLKTAAVLEKIVLVLFDEVGNLSPLDDRPDIPPTLSKAETKPSVTQAQAEQQ